MKKLLSLLLVLLLLCSLAACGKTSTAAEPEEAVSNPSAASTEAPASTETEDTTEDEVPASTDADSEASSDASSAAATRYETDELQISLGEPLKMEHSYTAEDGTLLLETKIELPQLQLTASDGTVCDLETGFETDSGSYLPPEAAICLTFNQEMLKAAETLESTVQDTLSNAQAQYDGLTNEQRETWGNYADELTTGTTYLTSNLLSVVGNGYAFYGGVHPSTYTRVWNYDLTTGEFITWDTLFGDENPNGQALSDRLSELILSQIDAQNLGEGYFPEYEAAVQDLSSNASFYFQESGIVIQFDSYILAPYAAGSQSFDISYAQFSDLLSEHVQSLLY